LGLRVEGLGLGFGVQASGMTGSTLVRGLEFKVSGLGLRFEAGLGFRVQGVGFRV